MASKTSLDCSNFTVSGSRYYDKTCDGCIEVVQIGKRRFCGYAPPRVGLHQVIRGQIGCVSWKNVCPHYHKNLDADVCLKCLQDHPDAPTFGMMDSYGQ